MRGGDIAPQDPDVPAGRPPRPVPHDARDPASADLGDELLGRCDRRRARGDTYSRTLVVDLVDRIRSDRRPTVLVFEDLQWADDLSLEAIAELARLARDLPLLVVGAIGATRRRPAHRCATGGRAC